MIHLIHLKDFLMQMIHLKLSELICDIRIIFFQQYFTTSSGLTKVQMISICKGWDSQEEGLWPQDQAEKSVKQYPGCIDTLPESEQPVILHPCWPLFHLIAGPA